MFQKRLCLVLFALTAAVALPGFAADANFQANCTYVDPDSFYCEFDAERTPMGQAATSCAPAVPTRYIWRFGDGGSDATTTPETDHVYTLGVGVPTFFSYYEACVSVGCSDGSTAFRCHCVDFFGQGLPGCVEPGGWTPF